MIGDKRAAWTAFFPIRSKHEVVNDQLASPRKEIRQSYLSVWSGEDIILVDLHPRKFATFRTQFVEQSNRFLLFLQQLFSSRNPVLSGYNVRFHIDRKSTRLNSSHL